jgi:hypothetical protein
MFLSDVSANCVNSIDLELIKSINKENGDGFSVDFPVSVMSLGFCDVVVSKIYSENDFEKENQNIINHWKPCDTTHNILFIPMGDTVRYRDLPDYENINEADTLSSYFDIKADSEFVVKIPDLRKKDSDKPAVIYINAAKEGQFLSDNFADFYSKTPNIQHGYSTGVYIDKKNLGITYWLMIW